MKNKLTRMRIELACSMGKNNNFQINDNIYWHIKSDNDNNLTIILMAVVQKIQKNLIHEEHFGYSAHLSKEQL